MMLRIVVCCIFVSLAGEMLTAQQISASEMQTIPDSSYKKPGIKMFFTKDISSYLLRTAFTNSLRTGNFVFSSDADITSGIITGGVTSTRDELILKHKSSYLVNDFLTPFFSLKANVLNDSRSAGIEEFSRFDLLGGVQIRSLDFLLSPFAGYSFNKLQNTGDKGLILGSDAEYAAFLSSDYLLSGMASFSNEAISPRRNLSRTINTILSGGSQSGIYTKTLFSYILNGKDFYTPADSIIATAYGITQNIQSRLESAIRAENDLGFKISDQIAEINLSIQYLRRTIDRTTVYRLENSRQNGSDARILESKFTFSPSVKFFLSGLAVQLSAGYSERSENHSLLNPTVISIFFREQASDREAQKNSTAGRIFVSGSIKFAVSLADSFEISFLQNKLQYDTPSASNDDDRDELLSIVRAGYSKVFNQKLSASFFIDAVLSKLVYLPSTRSGGNFLNRVFRLGTAVNYFSSSFRQSLRSEVSANYTLYDYENIIPSLKNFLFRQFTVSDSLLYAPSTNRFYSFNGFLRLSEQGQFFTKSFTIAPALQRSELLLNPTIGFRFDNLTLETGFRFFGVLSKNISPLLSNEDNYRSLGPELALTMFRNGIYSVNAKVWHEFITRSGTDETVAENTNLFISLEIKI